MTSPPPIDVVLPARDPDPRLFGRALGSVLRSRGVEVRVVVVDHGSVRPIAVSAPHVEVIRVDRALSFAAALNTGVAACRHDFVARMDADDLAHPDRLLTQARALKDDERLAAVACRVKIIPKTTTRMRGHAWWMNSILDEAAHRRERFVDLPVCHPTLMFRRRALTDAGGYRDEIAEDYELLLRLWSGGARIQKTPAMHLAWRQHDGQATRRIGRDALAALKVRFLVTDFALRDRAVVVMGAGKEGRRIARALQAVGIELDAFVDVDPRKIGTRARGVSVQPPSFLAMRRRGSFVIGAVGTSGARGAVRALWSSLGLVEDEDAICVA
jgi:glycosyltransferase involved in cell wall biosynthesis